MHIIKIGFVIMCAALFFVGGYVLWQNRGGEGVTPRTEMTTRVGEAEHKVPVQTKTALLANGCFWCVEHDIEKVAGVINAISGYAGGVGENPTYENYSEGGFREVVLVTYDANKLSFANLVEHIIKHGDPTDGTGSFRDRGMQYAPAIYYEDDSEKNDARMVADAIDALRVFDKPLPLVIVPRVEFWPAEEYHQDYAKKNPIRYGYYRGGSGRDAFIEKYWGARADEFTASE